MLNRPTMARLRRSNDQANNHAGGYRGPVNTRTLGELLEAMGDSLVQLVCAPRGRDVQISGTFIHEPRDPVPSVDHALMLLVGLRPASARAVRLVAEAAEADLAGVVVKTYGDPLDELRAAAEASGVALLAADEQLAWHQLETLVASALATTPRKDGAAPAMGDLFGLANAIAGLVGGATTIEDPHQRILAYSTLPNQPIDEDRRQGILGLHVPDNSVNDAQYRQLALAAGVCRFPAEPGGMPRLAVPVKAGDELLGSIWVVDADTGLGIEAQRALVEGARLAALHLLRARADDDLARRQRGELLRRVFDDAGSAAFVAPQLGLAADAPVVVVAFHVAVHDVDGVIAARSALRLTDLVTLHCEAYSGRHACALADGTVYAVLPADGPSSSQRELVAQVALRAQRALGFPVRAGLGSVVLGLHAATTSRREADLVLRALAAARVDDDEPLVATIDELWASAALVELAELSPAAPRLQGGIGPAILAHDRDHQTAYASTLLAYLEANSDVSVAARRLNIHANTCRYRLSRAEQIFGLRLADADARLVLWLQLRLNQDGPIWSRTGRPPRPTPS